MPASRELRMKSAVRCRSTLTPDSRAASLICADEVGAPARHRLLLKDEGDDEQGDHDQHRELDGRARDGQASHTRRTRRADWYSAGRPG